MNFMLSFSGYLLTAWEIINAFWIWKQDVTACVSFSPGSRIPARPGGIQVICSSGSVLLGFKHRQVLRGLLRGGAEASGSKQGQCRAGGCTREARRHQKQNQCKPLHWTETTGNEKFICCLTSICFKRRQFQYLKSRGYILWNCITILLKKGVLFFEGMFLSSALSFLWHKRSDTRKKVLKLKRDWELKNDL